MAFTIIKVLASTSQLGDYSKNVDMAFGLFSKCQLNTQILTGLFSSGVEKARSFCIILTTDYYCNYRIMQEEEKKSEQKSRERQI